MRTKRDANAKIVVNENMREVRTLQIRRSLATLEHHLLDDVFFWLSWIRGHDKRC